MISVEQRKEVRDYLLSKKIPLDVLMELEDHFLSQIDAMMDQNISFEKAFDEVKYIWSYELKMVKNYNGTENSVFAKKIRDRKINQILFQSLLLALTIVLGIILLIKYNTKDTYTDLMMCFLYILIGFPAFHYLFNIRNFTLISKYKSLQINVYQKLNSINFILIFIVVYGADYLLKMIERVFDFVENGSQIGRASFILICVYSFFYSFGFLSQIAFMKSMKKMKPYLTTFNL